ncbi:MAG TPA: serine hydrolase [Bacteroidia bacterium]|jgi:CubicO group peptidase (beta-lactamase class C family)|nr:serine hydrolase [Bacteroidia bacterium]
MKKFLKRTGYFLLFLFIAANLFIVITGKFYLYKGVWYTYLHGRKGPSATEYQIFSNREVKNGTPQPWPLAKDYNKKDIPDTILKKMEDIETGSFLIIQHDSIRCEKYWGEFTDHSYTNSFSMAKTVISILVGCAIQDGKIKSLDEPVSDFIPEFAKDDRKKLTIKNLLQMSSGINFDENYVNPLAYPAAAYYGSDLRGLTLGYTELNATPGEKFLYLSGNTQLLGFVLKAATGKTIADYASEKLWIPMGCDHNAFWSLDKEGGDEKAFCCLNSNARDFARIGKLYLDSGRWNGTQIVPEWYALQSVQPTGTKELNGDPALDYGLMWWLLPEYKGHHIFYARGILGQYVICIPDMDMIIVRLGQKRLPGDSNDLPKDTHYYLDAALQMYQ